MSYSYSSSHNSASSTPSPTPKRSSPESDLFVKIAVTVVSALLIVTILIYIAGCPSIDLHTTDLSSKEFQSIPNRILIYILTIIGSGAGAYFYFRN